MKPIIIKSGEGGAPVLTGEDGSLRTLFKWALPQLGWTEEFDDPANNQIVFRNNPLDGSGYYLKMFDNEADHDANSRATMFRAYSSMTDINTGTREYPKPTSSDQQYLFKSFSADNTPRDYIFVGTNKIFYLFIRTGDDADPITYSMFFFGDIISFMPGDSGAFMIGCGHDPYPSATTHLSPFERPNIHPEGSNDELDQIYNSLAVSYDGQTDGVGVFVYGFQSGPTNSTRVDPGTNGRYPSLISNGFTTTKIYVGEFNTSNSTRGYLPGLLFPNANIGTYNTGFVTGDIMNNVPIDRDKIGDVVFISFAQDIEGGFEDRCVLFSLSDWDHF